jgi:NADH dehydrogenase
VFALGSQLVRPSLPGLAEHTFDVDTFQGAQRLALHLAAERKRAALDGSMTVVVVGAGLTGIETATEMVGRLRDAAADGRIRVRIVLVDHASHVGSDMGQAARPDIERSLLALGIESRTGVSVLAVSADDVRLSSGEALEARTVIWCAGMHANPLTERIPAKRDRLGRIMVNATLSVPEVADVYVAGDAACARMAPQHTSVMSCQHSRPMGRFAGHNVICDLVGLPQLPLHIERYVTVLDLGACGALYTEGWDRKLVAVGPEVKQVKQTINRQRIYPPRTGKREDIFASAAPLVQAPPQRGHE